jgi:hypothetical protein
MDPSPAQVEDSLCELLFAGTATDIVMMECSSPTDRIKEEMLVDLMHVAHSALEPILEIQRNMISVKEEQQSGADRIIRYTLGLPPLDEEESEESHVNYNQDAALLFTEAYQYCHGQRKDSALRLFGYTNNYTTTTAIESKDVTIHPLDQPLLSKAVRGRREHLVFTEIQRLLKKEFRPQHEQLKEAYHSLVEQDRESLSALARAIHRRLLKEALYDTATNYKSRGDIRGGAGSSSGSGDVDACRVVRPISVTVPVLPDVVHGSAVFARGDTQVLCTTTLGAPMDGLPKTNPYQETTDPRMAGTDGKSSEGPKGPYDDLPVGSLRYLRSQEALVSDMNSRKIKADRELTGDSGTLDEVIAQLGSFCECVDTCDSFFLTVRVSRSNVSFCITTFLPLAREKCLAKEVWQRIVVPLDTELLLRRGFVPQYRVPIPFRTRCA